MDSRGRPATRLVDSVYIDRWGEVGVDFALIVSVTQIPDVGGAAAAIGRIGIGGSRLNLAEGGCGGLQESRRR